MVAYNFKQSFVPAVESGEKQQTIRRDRKRHARPGEIMQLQTGSRFKPRRFGLSTCLRAPEVRLDFVQHRVELDGGIDIDGAAELDAFAIRDGFRPPARFDVRPWDYMAKWWAVTHPGQPVFGGRLLDWGTTFKPWVQP